MDGRQIELLFDPERHTTAFAVWSDGTYSIEGEITIGNERFVPFSPNNNLIKNQAVLLPSRPEEYGSEDRLLVELESFLERYLDLDQMFQTVAVHYVLLSWLYDAFNELPYLRMRGDFGTGKTRALLVIGSVCYKPFFASGASTISPIFHTLNAFQGTLVFDEADFRFSDEKAEMVKILNNGNVRGMPVLRTVMNRQKEFNPQAFQVFGPKIVATRQTYSDRGLESRFITQEMGARALRKDIPINLPKSFADEALALRNKLLLYRFRRRAQTRLDASQLIPGLEPRLNQILLPLLSVATDPVRRLELRTAAAEAQGKLIADRGLNIEAHVLEVLADLMDKSSRPVVPVSDVTEALTERFGNEYERPVTNRWVGGILRKRLNIRTYKSHGVYVVPMTEWPSIELLCSRYGIYTLGELGADMGDVGTKGTSEEEPERED
jgi:hypothetical protein